MTRSHQRPCRNRVENLLGSGSEAIVVLLACVFHPQRFSICRKDQAKEQVHQALIPDPTLRNLTCTCTCTCPRRPRLIVHPRISHLHTASVELHVFLMPSQAVELVGARCAKPSDLQADMERSPIKVSHIVPVSQLGELRL